jgi:hypothetical protein
VERHLPERFRAGMAISAEDLEEIKRLLSRRDQHLQRLYRDNRALRREINLSRYGGGRDALAASRLEDAPTDLLTAARLVEVLRHRVRELETSTSWKITAPLRAVKRLISGSS